MLYRIFHPLLLFILVVHGQDNRPVDPNNHFLDYPGLPGPQASNNLSVFAENRNLTYGIPQATPFKWTTNMSWVAITLEQEGNPESVKSRSLLYCSPNHFIYWDGNIDPIDVNNGSIVYIAAWNCSASGSGGSFIGTPVFFSHYFNLTKAADALVSSTTTSGSSTGSVLPTKTGTTSLGGTMSPTATGASTNTITDSHSSNAAMIGAGLGGGLGGATLLIGAAVLYFRYQKKEKARNYVYSDQPEVTQYSYQSSSYTDPSYSGPAEVKYQPNPALAELPPQSIPYSHSGSQLHQLP